MRQSRAFAAQRRTLWGGIWSCSLLIILGSAVASPPAIVGQVTGRQGEQDPNEFRGSMILDVPFLPAVPALLPKMTDWYTTADLISLRKYHCDRIGIWPLKYRVKKPAKNGKIRVEMRVWLASPDQNHDKMVDLTLEVHNGDSVVGMVKRSIKVEEGDQIMRDLELSVAVSGLIADPVTQLRITVHTKDI